MSVFEKLEGTKDAIRAASQLSAEKGAESLHSDLLKLGCTLDKDKATTAESEEEECIALAFRMILEELVTENNKKEIPSTAIDDPRVVALLDIATHAALAAWVPRQLPLMVVHELFEGQTARQCETAFGYMEKRVDQMRKLTEAGEHKYSQAALLRCCNTLMQRLSKSSNLLLCGRVLMFLAHVLPLSEKSGVNLKGEFNKANVTEFEEALEGGEKERLAEQGGRDEDFMLKSTDEKLDGQMEVSFHLYKTFWGLQRYLHDPSVLLSDKSNTHIDEMSKSLSLVLDNFATYTLSDAEEMTGHTADREFFFPGFLTSTKLVSLELQDPTFRRHVMVQYLIVLHYLLDASVHPPKAIELTKKHRDDLAKHQERIFRLLEGIPPKGTQFVATLRRVLERESNWGGWKKQKCFDFSRTWPDDQDRPLLQVGDKRKEIDAAAVTWKRRFLTPKVKDSFISEACAAGNILEMCSAKANKDNVAEQIQTRLNTVREEADPENYIEEEYRKNSIPCWRWVTLRMLSCFDINLFSYATAENKFLEGVVEHMDGKLKKEGEKVDGKSEEGGKEGQEGDGTPREGAEPAAKGDAMEVKG
mmetsp:Transcript_10760/g.25763  ORF Transcript_10760/g.25763 Transcript_10760/m.25763 type:complete len:588 (+) Transcript_10760:287-2050(+)|eukprot:CAMPEP_0177714648 /NCGR_PEP_ID=MMETSP0484_2-20121128/13565_1 /TAXON_ID=354590 /ORGANISM="Rhodomonas lens, Strain RHODO" /LENGTH=587 /DNA_ID=CAMNT_0019226579 /DNA_START=287 /DNA_END=2050 /DNA_ORIENTATION=-